jgi:hypothetical protein
VSPQRCSWGSGDLFQGKEWSGVSTPTEPGYVLIWSAHAEYNIQVPAGWEARLQDGVLSVWPSASATLAITVSHRTAEAEPIGADEQLQRSLGATHDAQALWIHAAGARAARADYVDASGVKWLLDFRAAGTLMVFTTICADPRTPGHEALWAVAKSIVDSLDPGEPGGTPSCEGPGDSRGPPPAPACLWVRARGKPDGMRGPRRLPHARQRSPG